MKYDTKKSNTNINDDREFSRNEDVSVFTVIILFFELVFEVIKLIFWGCFFSWYDCISDMGFMENGVVIRNEYIYGGKLC